MNRRETEYSNSGGTADLISEFVLSRSVWDGLFLLHKKMTKTPSDSTVWDRLFLLHKKIRQAWVAFILEYGGLS